MLYRIRDIQLKIELSLPKLLFGNNFQELQHKDLAVVTQKLAITLESMGVMIDVDALAHAPVSAIHYAKNIILKDGSSLTITFKKSKNQMPH